VLKHAGMTTALDRDAAHALLDFYVESGVVWALDETPHDRFAEGLARREAVQLSRAATEARPSPPPDPLTARPEPLRAVPKAATAAPEEAALAARELARGAQTLEELEAIVAAFEGCALKVSAKSLAFADGTPQSRVMLVGEAPGGEEDRTGKPFVGRAGQLLDRMLGAIGLDRGQVYIANIVPWRPPGNRTPTPQEIAICLPFITRQIELAAPEVLVCLGGPSTQTLLGTKEGILRTRGRWFPYHAGPREIRALACLHPAYLLRQPLQKRLAWRDLVALRRVLDGRE
jgi:uracil-DNA glycosylase family 4